MITVPMNPNKRPKPAPVTLDPTPESDAIARELAASLPTPSFAPSSLAPPAPEPSTTPPRKPSRQVLKMRALNKQQLRVISSGLEPGVEDLIMDKVLPAKRVAIEKFTDRPDRPGFTDTNDPYTSCLREIDRRMKGTAFDNPVDDDDLKCRAIALVAAEHETILATLDPAEQEKMQLAIPQKVFEGFLRNRFPELRFLQNLPDRIRLPGGGAFTINTSPADPARNSMIVGPDEEVEQDGLFNFAHREELRPRGFLFPNHRMGPATTGNRGADTPRHENPMDTEPPGPQISRPDDPDRGFGIGDRGNLRLQHFNSEDDAPRVTDYRLQDIQRLQQNSPLGQGILRLEPRDDAPNSGEPNRLDRVQIGPFTYSQRDRDIADAAIRNGILTNLEAMQAHSFRDGFALQPQAMLDDLNLFSMVMSPKAVAALLEERFDFQYTVARDASLNFVISFAQMDVGSMADRAVTMAMHVPGGSATPNNLFAMFAVGAIKELAEAEGVGVLVTGHSLGGGLAAPAALAHNVPAMTFASIETMGQLQPMEDVLPDMISGSLTGPAALARARSSQFNIVRSTDFLAQKESPALQTVEIEPSEERGITGFHGIESFADTVGNTASITLTTRD